MAVVVSAPGKVLMTGGYLILDRPNAGIVLSTNARFYAIVKPFYDAVRPESWAWIDENKEKVLGRFLRIGSHKSCIPPNELLIHQHKAWTDVKLTSPQMSRETVYKLSLEHLTLQCVSPSESRNPFVELAVQYAIAAACATLDKSKKQELNNLLLQGLDITILGSNDFYSYRNQIEAQGLPLTPETLAVLPPFSSITFNKEELGEVKPEVAKTGLGSSAAMTTAVVAALLHYLGIANVPSLSALQNHGKDMLDLDLVHIVAQSAHCIAQGKVGSGFDVSSAVYGSQRYVRFSPGVLSSAQIAMQDKSLSDVISDVLKGNWDHERTSFSLPPLMTLLLGEPGIGGSSTPSMVGAVKKWQKSDPQRSQETWRKLSEANAVLESQLNELGELAEKDWVAYKSIISRCSTLKAEKWLEQADEQCQEAIVTALLSSRDAMLGIRSYMRQMGEAAGIPIEPESQTRLLDATMNIEGVLLAGVPGAGGFDAIFAVTLSDSISLVTKAWSNLNVLALLVREDPHGVCLESNDPLAKEITSGISSVHIQ